MRVLAIVAFACGGAQTVAPLRSTLTVSDAGAEPRQVLRYTPVAHAPERMVSDLKLRVTRAFTSPLEQGHTDVDLPTVSITSRLEATAADAVRGADITFVVETVGVHDDVVDAAVKARADRESAALVGARGSFRVAPSGDVSDVVIETPSQLSMLADSLRSSSVVFPDQAIGVGARWQVISEHTAYKITWRRTAKYYITALTDSTVTIVADVAMTAPPQALRVEPNATTQLTSGTASATIELVVPLHGLVATISSQATSETNLQIVRKRLRMTATITTAATFSSAPPH